MSTLVDDIARLVGELQAEVASQTNIPLQVRKTEEVLTRFLASDGTFDMAALRPNPEKYARYLLYGHPEDRFSVVAMVWAPGQHTAIHDHDGVWCVEGVFQNELAITQFDMQPMAGENRLLMTPQKTVRAGRGAVGNLIPPFEFHRIQNQSGQIAISVHVYGRELKQCNRYLPNPDGSYRREVVSLCYDGQVLNTSQP